MASVADAAATDLSMKGRSGEWYRARLRRSFRQVGFGLWVRRNSGVALWELEAAE
jgi:hypothetical protein